VFVLRPYRALAHPWTTGLAMLGSLAFLAGMAAGHPGTSLYALGLLAVSYPVSRALSALLLRLNR
jgi:hypothetical protein